MFWEPTYNVYFLLQFNKIANTLKESMFMKLTSLAEKQSQIFICKQLPLGVTITIAKLCLPFLSCGCNLPKMKGKVGKGLISFKGLLFLSNSGRHCSGTKTNMSVLWVGCSPVVRRDSINCLVCLIEKTVSHGHSSSPRSAPSLKGSDQHVLFRPSEFFFQKFNQDFLQHVFKSLTCFLQFMSTKSVSYVISQYIVSAQKIPSAICFLHIKSLPLLLHEENVINKYAKA